MTSTAPASIAGAEDLLAQALEIDGSLNAPAPGTPEAAELERQAKLRADLERVPLEQEIAGAFAMLGAGMTRWLPRAGAVLISPDEKGKCAADYLGDVLAPVARKYGLDRYLENFAWRHELQALTVTVPIAAAVVIAAKMDLAERRQARAAPPATSSPIVVPQGLGPGYPPPGEIKAAPPAGELVAAAPPGALQPVAGYGVQLKAA